MKYPFEKGMSKMFKEEILKLYGKKSFGLIAKELGITRHQVSGIVFRHNHPVETRIGKDKNKIGTGYKRGKPAPETLVRQVW